MADQSEQNNDQTAMPTPSMEGLPEGAGSRRWFMKGAGAAGVALAAGLTGVNRTAVAGNHPPVGHAPCEPRAVSTADNDTVPADEMLARYRRARQIDEATFMPRKLVFNATVYPHWIDDTDQFWYEREIRTGRTFRLVNAARQTNVAAFDHRALARALSKQSGEQIDPDNLPLAHVAMALSTRTVTFSAFGADWLYNDHTKRCSKLDTPLSPLWHVSPDGKWGVLVRDYNLWVREMASGRERPLTRDGERFHEYAGGSTVYGTTGAPITDVLWSPDSKRLLTQLRDTRNVEKGMPLVQHVPPDGSLRPNIINPGRRVAFAGDENVEAWQLLSVEVESGTIRFFDCPPQPLNFPAGSCFGAHRGWWGDSRYAYFAYQHMDGTDTRVFKLDSHTGKTAVLFGEDPANRFQLIPISHLAALALPLPETNELIWWSDRSGWSHLYLYDTLSGKLKNTITQGDWLVRNILHFDAEKRELFIQTAGREPGRNPYYRDICRVNIDTGELTTLIASDHEYVVCDPRDRVAYGKNATGISPSGRYVVTTRSRVDDTPVSLLLDRDGRELMILETAYIHGMPETWHPPEPVMLKAADGETDIYAVVTRPSDFSPDKTYPVIDFTWPWPPIGAFSNNFFGNWVCMPPAAYAELGFIVVQVASRGGIHRGGEYRNKVFQDFADPSVPAPYDRADSVAAVRQLAGRYPQMDINRVGAVDQIVTHGALSALLVYPDFYKVGTVLSPVDTRLTPMQVPTTHPSYETFADNLRGKLLLMHGMLSKEPVSATFRLVEALQKANKRFDMLLLPNLGDGWNDYTTRASWDYFLTHLLGAEPPGEFTLAAGGAVNTVRST